MGEAYKALQTGDAATAVTSYTAAIESRALSPEVLANALLNRGLAYQRLNEHDSAIADYTAAMRIDAMSAKLRALALYNRGLSYQRTQKSALAIEDFTSALFLDSQFAHAYYSRGTLLRDQGQMLFALADFDKALRFNYPDPARVYFAESLTYEKLKRSADARDALDKALAANPDYEPAKQRMAALNGQTQQVASSGADQFSTAAVTPAKNTVLPDAAAPSQAVLDEGNAQQQAEVTDGAVSKKKYTDRITPSDRVVAEAPAKARPQAAVASAEQASSGVGEKVLAVETVPDDNAGAETQTADAAPSDAAPSDASVEPASAAPETQAQTGWSVQLASASSEDAAWSTWKKMQGKNKALQEKKPVVVKADLGTKGVFYRVRLMGFDTQDAANSECSALKRKGVRCYISKASS